MPRPRLVPAAFVGAAGLALALAFTLPALGSADDPVPKPMAEIKDLMLTVNDDGTETAVQQQLKAAFEKGTLTDEEWAVAKGRAAVLGEAGNLLIGLKPPKGADTPEGLAEWKKRAAGYRDAAAVIHAAAVKKDAAGGKAAVQALNKLCNACHKVHQNQE